MFNLYWMVKYYSCSLFLTQITRAAKQKLYPSQSSSMNSTPLMASTSRRDLYNSPAIANPAVISPKITQPDDSAIAGLTITAGKLKDLETEIAAEALELGTLKAAITKSEQTAHRLLKILGSYEARMGEVERIVMPVYRNILNMAQVNDRIEGTMGFVERLIKINEQVRKEVVILLPGPTIDTLLVYLDATTRLESIHNDLVHSELAHCKISLDRASAAISDSREKLHVAYRAWLSEDDSNDSIVQALKTIVDYSLPSPAYFSALITDWIEIRSNYLAASCEALFAAAQNFEKDPAGYQPGTHPLPEAYNQARSLLQNEQVFITKIWPTTAVGPTFLRSAQIVRDLAVSTVENITGKMKKALVRREYADQVYLFNVLGSCYGFVNSTSESSGSLAVQVLLPSLKFFITTTASLLTDLIGEIRGTIPRALERPFAVAQNATVYELTSITVNVLKRAEKDDVVIESILKGQASDNWDGSLAPSDDLSNIKRFYTSVLGSLESSIDTKSKTLRRPMQTLLFQLNNYNYLARGLAQIKAELVEGSVLKRYEQIIEALKRSFNNSWTMIANLISSDSAKQLQTTTQNNQSNPSSARSAPKDRLKAFTLEFDEAARIQQACAVPDVDLRTELRAKVKESILPVYIIFYNQNQALFTSTPSAASKYHDPDQIENQISHLFEG